MASAQLQPSCVSGLSHCPRVWVLSRSQFNSPFLFGTEKVRRDTKSLDLGQQHTGTKDDLITYLCLGMAIGHFLSGGTSNIERGAWALIDLTSILIFDWLRRTVSTLTFDWVRSLARRFDLTFEGGWTLSLYQPNISGWHQGLSRQIG